MQVELKNISCMPCTPKISFLSLMPEFKMYIHLQLASSLRRHKIDQITEQKSPTFALT